MAIKLQHGDSLYQVIEKVNEIIDGTVQPGSGGGSGGSGSSSSTNVTTSMLEAETDRATSAEQYLQDQIDIINNLIGAGDGDEADSNTGEDNELQAALIMESIHAATREHNNAQDIAGEVARAQAAEQTLQTNINNETTRATTAEQNLQTNINNEVTRATTAEQNLQDQIDAIDISGLQQDIDNEVTRATAAEQSLQTDIDNEVTRAQAAEQNLQDQIDDITPVKETYSATLNGEKGSTWVINATRYNGIITIGIGYQLGSGQTTVAGETVSSTDVLLEKWRPCMSIHELTAMFANQTQYMFRVIINSNGQLQFTNGSSGTSGTWSRIWCYSTYIAGNLT